MISYAEAISKVLEQIEPLAAEILPIDNILKRGLAESIIAPFDQPRFDNSSVDGYGVKVSDLIKANASPVKLKLIAMLKAGMHSDHNLRNGEAIKLFTGSAIPPGVEAVVMREFCSEDNTFVNIDRSVMLGENIRRQASELKCGQTVIDSGIQTTPPIIGLLASLGYSHFSVGSKPHVALIVTGDEIVQPGKSILPGQIYDANSYSLMAALKSLGIENISYEYVVDQYENVKEAIARALKQADVVISSGGISVGSFDFVKKAVEALGVQTEFWQVAVKPGRPIYFGTLEPQDKTCRKIVFGLPGNTVSVLITFHQFVKPALLKMMSITIKDKTIKASVDANAVKLPGRLELLRAKLSCAQNGQARIMPIAGQDSHMLSSLALADSLLHFPLESTCLDKDSLATVERISWYE